MARQLKIEQLSKKQFAQGQTWAADHGDPRLQYLAGLSRGSPLRVLDLGEDDQDDCFYLGLKPKAKLPVVVEYGGQVFAVAMSDVLKAEADEDRGLLPGGETLCIAQPLAAADLNRIHSCDHKWVVYSTALAEVWLMLKCLYCGAHGSVDYPTSEEWGEAFDAASNPYTWPAKSRVTIRGCLPDTVRHVLRLFNYETTPESESNDEQ